MSIPDSRFTQLFCRTATSDGVITQYEGWKDPIIGDKFIDRATAKQMDTNEQGIRMALIELGWTPPEEV